MSAQQVTKRPRHSSKSRETIPNLSKTAKGYRYRQRVPRHLVHLIGSGWVEARLGSDYAAACVRCVKLTESNEARWEWLSDPENQHEEASRGLDDVARQLGETARELATARVLAVDPHRADQWLSWLNAEKVMESAEAANRGNLSAEVESLKVYLALSFGAPPPLDVAGAMHRALMDNIKPTLPPQDRAALADAMRGMVEARICALERRLEARSPAKPNRDRLLSTYLEAYLAQRGLREQTRRGHTSKVNQLISFSGDREIDQYTQADIRAYRDYLMAAAPSGRNLKPQSAKAYLGALRAIWEWTAQEFPESQGQLLFPNVASPRVRSSVEEDRWLPFLPHETARIWALAKRYWGPTGSCRADSERKAACWMAFQVMLYTGARPNEVFELTTDDVQGGMVRFRVTKTGPRALPLSVHLKHLPKFLAETAFPSGYHKEMSEQFTALIRKNGFLGRKHVLYSLRSTLVNQLQQQGRSQEFIRGVIGHKGGIGMLKHYLTPISLVPNAVKEIKAALDDIRYWETSDTVGVST